jgi:endonuclease/exonuclease/phosphatase family metal-dependent hydrolase
MRHRLFALLVLLLATTLALAAVACDDDDDDDVTSPADDDATPGDDDATPGDDDDDASPADDDDDDDDNNDDDNDDDDDTAPPAPEPFKVMTFNLRTGLSADGENAWNHRRQLVADFIDSEMPDVMGVQEALTFQLTFIEDNVPGYAWVGRSRRVIPDEYSAVFYRTDKFALVDEGTFWLSDTPEVVGSRFTNNQLCPRIVTWVELTSLATGRTLFVFNTHWDTYHGEDVHERSAALMVAKIAEIAGEAPVFVTGDFNEAAGNSGYGILTGGLVYDEVTGNLLDPWPALDLIEEGTFHGFTGVPTGEVRIDWVLATADFAPTAGEIAHFNQDGRYPSDHFPVWNEFLWPAQSPKH